MSAPTQAWWQDSVLVCNRLGMTGKKKQVGRRENRAELNTNWEERRVSIYAWAKQVQTTTATFSSCSSKIKKFKVWE